jgi:hypothetical protein
MQVPSGGIMLPLMLSLLLTRARAELIVLLVLVVLGDVGHIVREPVRVRRRSSRSAVSGPRQSQGWRQTYHWSNALPFSFTAKKKKKEKKEKKRKKGKEKKKKKRKKKGNQAVLFL